MNFFVLDLCNMQRKSSMTLDILMTISSAATPQGKGYLMVVTTHTPYYAILPCPQNSAPAISLGSFGKRNLCSQWDGSACTHGWSSFLRGDGGRGFFCFVLFFPCSHQVPKMFPHVFPKMFPTAPGFYPVWFAQSSTPMYTNWKGEI
jgi:hypothetical protein